MKIKIIGDGVFGNFFREIAGSQCDIDESADIVVLAVPHHAYAEVAEKNKDKHLINVCSIQSTTTQACLAVTNRVTSVHPMFGPKTPDELWKFVVTHQCGTIDEKEFLKRLPFFGYNFDPYGDVEFFHPEERFEFVSPEDHDRLMARTHARALKVMRLVKPIVDEASDIPDALIPHSFRKLRQLVEQFNDMPTGTVESIMANPFLKENL